MEADLTPVSFHSETDQKSGGVSIIGHRDGDQFVLTRTSHGVKREASIDLSENPIFVVALPRFLANTSDNTDNIKVRVINADSLSASWWSCTRSGDDQKGVVEWTIANADSGSVITRISLRDGQRIGERAEQPSRVIKPATAADAKNLTPWVNSGRDILMFQVNQPIAIPENLTSLTVQLQWRNIPIDQFKLEDARQKLGSHSAEDGQHHATIQVLPYDQDATTLESVPVTTLDTALGTSTYIQPNHANVVEHANKWAGESEDQLAVVKALAKELNLYLLGSEIVAETLSGPEVLEAKCGKCSEYATCFASLARAKNIPTRIALGERMMGGKWIGHMWNEVFIAHDEQPDIESKRGHWITVDATTNEVGHAPGLLKFIHGPTVQSTQALRFELTKSLDIKITDFDEQAPSNDWTTGVDGDRYTNAEFSFRVTAPKGPWKFKPGNKPGPAIIRIKNMDDEKVQLHSVAVGVPSIVTPLVMVSARDAQFRLRYKDYKVHENADTTVGGRTWRKFQFSHTVPDKDAEDKSATFTMKTTEFIHVDGAVAYLINLICDEERHDKHYEDLESVIESFETAE